jgi:hypothetical protein
VVKRKTPSPRRESNPRTPTVQIVAQSYIDRVITVLYTSKYAMPEFGVDICASLTVTKRYPEMTPYSLSASGRIVSGSGSSSLEVIV